LGWAVTANFESNIGVSSCLPSTAPAFPVIENILFFVLWAAKIGETQNFNIKQLKTSLIPSGKDGITVKN